MISVAPGQQQRGDVVTVGWNVWILRRCLTDQYRDGMNTYSGHRAPPDYIHLG